MINVKEFLLKQNIEIDAYALVTYDNKTEPTYFSRFNLGDGNWFLESPCELYKVLNLSRINESKDDYLKEYVLELIEDENGVDDYIDKFVTPMIIDDVLYEIENFQCSPYLPKEVDEIKIVSERECLEYILSTRKVEE